eukprot:m.213009 g.213009  ORF g.213009 m.213009 type:complete len:158 (+) comp39782_c0_seq22:2207-2680(+)
MTEEQFDYVWKEVGGHGGDLAKVLEDYAREVRHDEEKTRVFEEVVGRTRTSAVEVISDVVKSGSKDDNAARGRRIKFLRKVDTGEWSFLLADDENDKNEQEKKVVDHFLDHNVLMTTDHTYCLQRPILGVAIHAYLCEHNSSHAVNNITKHLIKIIK